MNDRGILEKKINDLEIRVRKLEDKIAAGQDTDADMYMEQLYETAKKLVVKHNRASIIFLQRKLLIDFQRAQKIMEMLEMNGVVSVETGAEPRKVSGGK